MKSVLLNNVFLMIAMVSTTAMATAAHADFLRVCERTPAVKVFLERAVAKTCDKIAESDLTAIKRVAVPGQNIQAFRDGDFSGLPNLEILNIKGNPFKTLNRGLLAELPKLKTLVIFRTGLTEVPDDFLENNPLIENLHMFGSVFTTLPETVWARFNAFQHFVQVDFDQALETASGGRLSRIFREGGSVSLILH